MEKSMKIIFATVILSLFVYTLTVQGQEDPSPDCLGCICQASTGCNITYGCSTPLRDQCGPFLITWSFWKDAGQPVVDAFEDPNQKGVFQKCVTSPYCAAETIIQYMRKLPDLDCDGNGKRTCSDFARVHQFGPRRCNAKIPSDNAFFKEYLECEKFLGLE